MIIVPDVRAFIPSAFSPNNSGEPLNDTFRVNCYGITDFHLQIFSRWGELIYESTNYEDHGWFGNYFNSNKIVPIGTYVCILRIKGKDGKSYKYSTSITLIR